MRMLFPHHRTDSAAGGTPGQLEVLAQSDETALVDAHAMLTTHHRAAIDVRADRDAARPARARSSPRAVATTVATYVLTTCKYEYDTLQVHMVLP